MHTSQLILAVFCFFKEPYFVTKFGLQVMLKFIWWYLLVYSHSS